MFGNSDGTFRDLEYEEVKNMPVMDSCIREALRLVCPPPLSTDVIRKLTLYLARTHSLDLPKSDFTHYRPSHPSRPFGIIILHHPNFALHARCPRCISHGPPNLARRRNLEPCPMDR